MTGWHLIVGAACVAAFVMVLDFFVRTGHGQRLDTIALTGNSIGQARIDDLVDTVLNAMSLVSLAAATAVLAFIALIRGRRGLALMVLLLIVGANATAQLLKFAITRPNLGIDVERAAAGNSLPSGHTTVAASVAVALVLVLPPTVRAVGAVLGAGYAALAGVATMSAGWHRPSDAIAAVLVVGGWTAAVSTVLLLAQRREDFVRDRESHPVATTVLLFGGLVLFVAAVIAFQLTDQVRDITPDELSRRRLFAAYAGGAAGIGATTLLVVGLLLATVHRVVPHRSAAVETTPAADVDEEPTDLLPADEPPTKQLS